MILLGGILTLHWGNAEIILGKNPDIILGEIPTLYWGKSSRYTGGMPTYWGKS